jgi:hypothetical protein
MTEPEFDAEVEYRLQERLGMMFSERQDIPQETRDDIFQQVFQEVLEIQKDEDATEH